MRSEVIFKEPKFEGEGLQVEFWDSDSQETFNTTDHSQATGTAVTLLAHEAGVDLSIKDQCGRNGGWGDFLPETVPGDQGTWVFFVFCFFSLGWT